MSLISARNVSKSFGAEPLLKDVSLTLEKQERVGLLGRNGAGKSTLLRILAGLESADLGTVERQRGARILYLSQEPRFEANLSARELVEAGMSDWKAAVERYAALSDALARSQDDAALLLEEQSHVGEAVERLGGWNRGHLVEQVLAELGIREPDRAMGTLSGGEQRRVALARVLVAEPDLAILDEPTNHLDADTIEWLETYLVQSFRGAVLLVTHDRYVLDAICDRICEIDAGRSTEYRGNYADYLEQKAELERHAQRVEDNRLNLLRRERAWLMRGAKARTTKQKARLERAQALLEASAPREAACVSLEELSHGASRTGKTILDLRAVSLEIAGKRLIDELTLCMVTGQRIGIIGSNGAGKTSLLRLAVNQLTPSSGEVILGQQTRIAFLDQTREELHDDWSIFDNIAERQGADRTMSGVVEIGQRTYELRSYLEQFSFRSSQQRQKVGALSGGERARVALAKVLCSGGNLLLLDEPTNDLDIQTLNALESLLENWAGCALIVSHDRFFLDRVATSILAFEERGRVVQYPGGYASYRSLREQARAQVMSSAPVAEPARKPARSDAASPPLLRSLTYAERLELEGLLERITEAETAVRDLELQLAQPAAYSDVDSAKRLTIDYEAARGRVEALTSRWEELETRRDVKR
jgi:ABC transport system ATP-binding/permease protein